MKRKFVIDEEISFLKENDILKTKVYADSLVKIIKNTPQDKVFTIGLFGSWGSGKSSIIKTVKDTIEKEDDKVKFITYDAWKYVNDSFRRMFLLKIQQELKQGQTEVMQRFYQSESVEAEPKTYVSTNGLGMLCLGLLAFLIIIWSCPIEFDTKAPIFSGITLIGLLITIFGGIFQKLKIQINKPIVFAPEQFEDCFREMISKALKKRNIINNTYTKAKDYVELGECSVTNLNKLVIVIDNIDRCHNEMAYQLLTDIKTFLSDEKLNVVFVIPVDDEALKRNIFSNNNCNKEKEEFLRKFFNVTLRIKPHQTTELNTYARELNNKNGLGFSSNTIALCSKQFAKNPRRIIQLFNNLSSELCQYSSKFVEKNESAICAVLILKEEYPNYYKSIIDDPYKFKECRIDDKNDDENVDSFIRFVAPIARSIEIKDLLKILTNSDAVFDAIPDEIRKAIDSYDVDATIKHIGLKPELKNDIFVLIQKNIADDIKSESNVQIINSLEFISTLSVTVDFEHVFLNEIDILYKPYYANLLERIDKNKLENLCSFALVLYKNGFKDLKTNIIQHVTNIGEENENIDEPFIKAVFTVFNTDEDSKELSHFATKLFDNVDIYTGIQYSTDQFNSLLSEELVHSRINAIRIGENKETEELLWLFEHKKNITEESYSLLFDKIQQLIGSTANKVKSDMLKYISYTMEYIQLIENCKINNTDNLSDLNLKLESRKISGINTHIIDDYKTETEKLHLIIDYIIHIYRISNGVITTNQVSKMCLHDKEYTYLKLMNLLQQGFDLKPFHNVIMNDEDYSQDNLISLTEHYLMMIDNVESSINDIIIWDKFNSLLDNITDHKIQKLIERLVTNQSVKAITVEAITRRNTQYINALPKSLLRLAVSSFNEETALQYEENMDFLVVIASEGSTEQKNKLAGILNKNITDKKYLDKTFDILDVIELKESYSEMICGALKSLKESEYSKDERIDNLIQKFTIAH